MLRLASFIAHIKPATVNPANQPLTREQAVVDNDIKKEKKRRAKMEISVAVGKAIAERRKIARMTQQKVAEALERVVNRFAF